MKSVELFFPPHSPQLRNFLQKFTAFTASLTKIYPKTSTQGTIYTRSISCFRFYSNYEAKHNENIRHPIERRHMLKTPSGKMIALGYDGLCEGGGGGVDRGKNYIVAKQHGRTKVSAKFWSFYSLIFSEENMTTVITPQRYTQIVTANLPDLRISCWFFLC